MTETLIETADKAWEELIGIRSEMSEVLNSDPLSASLYADPSYSRTLLERRGFSSEGLEVAVTFVMGSYFRLAPVVSTQMETYQSITTSKPLSWLLKLPWVGKKLEKLVVINLYVSGMPQNMMSDARSLELVLDTKKRLQAAYKQQL